MRRFSLIFAVPVVLAFTTEAMALKCHVPALSKRGECNRTHGGVCNPMTGKWEARSQQTRQACLATGSGKRGQ